MINIFILLYFTCNYAASSDDNQSLLFNNDLIKYMQFGSQNVFVENLISELYFSNQTIFTSIYSIQYNDLKNNINVLKSIVDKNNNPDLFFLMSTILYFGLFSTEQNFYLSHEYLSKSASLNHSLAQVLQFIFEEDENGTNILNALSSNINFHPKKLANGKTEMSIYKQLYIANKLYYDYKANYTDPNSEKCSDILKVYGIERSNLHFIPLIRNSTNCYKVYKIFRHHKHRDALNLVRSLSDKICYNEFPYSEKSSFDDPYIVAYYISKYDCDLSLELIRHSLHNHAAISGLLQQANEMEKKQNLDFSFKLYKILSHLGIDSAIENSVRISKILNAKLPTTIKKMSKINDRIIKENCADDLAAAFIFRSDLLTSLSYLKHAVKLIPQSIFIAAPFRVLIILLNFFNSNQNSEKYFSVYNLIRDNIDLSIFCIGTLAFTYLIKLRLEIFFMTS